MKNLYKKPPFIFFLILIIFSFGFIALKSVSAQTWDGPTASFPDGNPSVPIPSSVLSGSDPLDFTGGRILFSGDGRNVLTLGVGHNIKLGSHNLIPNSNGVSFNGLFHFDSGWSDDGGTQMGASSNPSRGLMFSFDTDAWYLYGREDSGGADSDGGEANELVLRIADNSNDRFLIEGENGDTVSSIADFSLSNNIRFYRNLDMNGNSIEGLDLDGGGITGSNYNISGVNQLSISDPGEGINFHGKANIEVIDWQDDRTNDDLSIQSDGDIYLDSGSDSIRINNPSGGSSEIRFISGVNSGSDYGYIAGVDDYDGGTEGSSENFALVLRTENDGAGSEHHDDIVIDAAGETWIQPNGGNVGIGTIQPATPLNITGGNDVKAGENGPNTGTLTIGSATGQHLAMDNNEIMSKSDGESTSSLHVQWDGGLSRFGGNLDMVQNDIVDVNNLEADTINGVSTDYLSGAAESCDEDNVCQVNSLKAESTGNDRILGVFARPGNVGSAKPSLMVAGDGESNDVIFSARSNTDGEDVDTSNLKTSSDDIFRIWGDGAIQIKNNLLLGGYELSHVFENGNDKLYWESEEWNHHSDYIWQTTKDSNDQTINQLYLDGDNKRALFAGDIYANALYDTINADYYVNPSSHSEFKGNLAIGGVDEDKTGAERLILRGGNEQLFFHMGGNQAIVSNAHYNSGWKYGQDDSNGNAGKILFNESSMSFRVAAENNVDADDPVNFKEAISIDNESANTSFHNNELEDVSDINEIPAKQFLNHTGSFGNAQISCDSMTFNQSDGYFTCNDPRARWVKGNNDTVDSPIDYHSANLSATCLALGGIYPDYRMDNGNQYDDRGCTIGWGCDWPYGETQSSSEDTSWGTVAASHWNRSSQKWAYDTTGGTIDHVRCYYPPNERDGNL